MNPAVVDETANIPDAAKKIVWGRLAWGGQWCTSPGYAYVHESVADAFVAEAKKALVERLATIRNPLPTIRDHQRAHGRSAGGAHRPFQVIAAASQIGMRTTRPHAPLSDHLDDKIMEDESSVNSADPDIQVLRRGDDADGENGTSARRFISAATRKPSSGSSASYLRWGGVNLVNVHLFVGDHAVWRHRVRRIGHYYGKYASTRLRTPSRC